MIGAERDQEHALKAARREAGEPHEARDRLAILVVLVGGLLAGVIVSWNLTSGFGLALPRVDLFGPRQNDQVARKLSGYQPEAAAPPAGCVSERPALDPSFDALHQRLASVMGQPGECAHLTSGGGDLVQQTSTGLAIRRVGDGVVIFTNGVEHWALAGDALLFWRGSSVAPPGDAQRLAAGVVRPDAISTKPPEGGAEVATVNGTDGAGVVLRASPRDDDWTPRGFMDGTSVEVLERSGNEWARIRGPNNEEGWVPARYLH